MGVCKMHASNITTKCVDYFVMNYALFCPAFLISKLSVGTIPIHSSLDSPESVLVPMSDYLQNKKGENQSLRIGIYERNSVCILIQMSMKYVTKGPVNRKPVLPHIMALLG